MGLATLESRDIVHHCPHLCVQDWLLPSSHKLALPVLVLGDLPLRPKGGDLGKEQVREFDEFDEMIRKVCLKTPMKQPMILMETSERFNFPEEWAALVPSSFYLASMLPRFANTYLARRILASTLVHVSLIFVSWRSHFLVRPWRSRISH